MEKEKDREGGDWYVGQLVVYRGKEREFWGGGFGGEGEGGRELI